MSERFNGVQQAFNHDIEWKQVQSMQPLLVEGVTTGLSPTFPYRDIVALTVCMDRRIAGAPNISCMKRDSTNNARMDLARTQLFFAMVENYLAISKHCPSGESSKRGAMKLRPVKRGNYSPDRQSTPETQPFFLGEAGVKPSPDVHAHVNNVTRNRSGGASFPSDCFNEAVEEDGHLSDNWERNVRSGLPDDIPDAQLFCELCCEYDPEDAEVGTEFATTLSPPEIFGHLVEYANSVDSKEVEEYSSCMAIVAITLDGIRTIMDSRLPRESSKAMSHLKSLLMGLKNRWSRSVARDAKKCMNAIWASVAEDDEDAAAPEDMHTPSTNYQYITFYFLMNSLLDVDGVMDAIIGENEYLSAHNTKNALLSSTKKLISETAANSGYSTVASDDPTQPPTKLQKGNVKARTMPRTSAKNFKERWKPYMTVTKSLLPALRDHYLGSSDMLDFQVGLTAQSPKSLAAQDIFSVDNAISVRTKLSKQDRCSYEHMKSAGTRAYESEDFDSRGFKHFTFPRPSHIFLVPAERSTLENMMTMTIPRSMHSEVHPIADMFVELWDQFGIPQCDYTPGPQASSSEQRYNGIVDTPEGVCNKPERIHSVIDWWVDIGQKLWQLTEDVQLRTRDPIARRCMNIIHRTWCINSYRKLRNSFYENSEATRCVFQFMETTDVYNKPRPVLQNLAPDMSPMTNLVANMAITNDRDLHAAEPHLLTFLWVQHLMSSNKTLGEIKGAVILIGGSGKSKSWLLRCVDRVLAISSSAGGKNLRTTFPMQHFSDRAFQTSNAVEMDGRTFIMEELPRTTVHDGCAEREAAVNNFKEMLESNECHVAHLAVVEEGNRAAKETHARVRSGFLCAANWSRVGIQNSMTQRFLFVSMQEREPGNQDLVDQMLKDAVCNSLGARGSHRSTLLHKEIQCVVADMHNLMAAGFCKPIDQVAGLLICRALNAYLARFDADQMNPRTVKRICRYASILCILDWFAGRYLLPGGARYNESVTLEDFGSAEAELVLKPSHVIHSIGMHARYIFLQGEPEFKAALRSMYHRRIEDHIKRNASQFSEMSDGYVTRTGEEGAIGACFKKECSGDDGTRVAFGATVHPKPRPKKGKGAKQAPPPVPDEKSHILSNDILEMAQRGELEGFDPQEWELNYIYFPMPGARVRNFISQVRTKVREMGKMVTPSPDDINVLLKNLSEKSILSHPMMFNPRDVANPVSPDPESPKKLYTKIIMTSDCVYVHAGYLLNDFSPEPLLIMGLKDLFNKASESPARRYIYGPGKGATYNVLTLGIGYVPAVTEDGDPGPVVLNPLRNPGVTRLMSFPGACNASSSGTGAESMFTNITEPLEDFFCSFRVSVCGITKKRISPELLKDVQYNMSDYIFDSVYKPCYGSVETFQPKKAKDRTNGRRVLDEVIFQEAEDLYGAKDVDCHDEKTCFNCEMSDAPENPIVNSARVKRYASHGLRHQEFKMRGCVLPRPTLSHSELLEASYPHDILRHMKRACDPPQTHAGMKRGHSETMGRHIKAEPIPD